MRVTCRRPPKSFSLSSDKELADEASLGVEVMAIRPGRLLVTEVAGSVNPEA